jgi:hypothetical protein
MRSQTQATRRIYVRNGTDLVLFGGAVFRPTKAGTKIDPAREVRVEPIDPAGGRKRVEVQQKRGAQTVKEGWVEQRA